MTPRRRRAELEQGDPGPLPDSLPDSTGIVQIKELCKTAREVVRFCELMEKGPLFEPVRVTLSETKAIAIANGELVHEDGAWILPEEV